MTASSLTTVPQHAGQPHELCPVTKRVVFIPQDTGNKEWKHCEACGYEHRVVFVDGDRMKPVLRSL